MKTARLIFTFYKSFALTSLIITLLCLLITYTWGIDTFEALFWFKIITLALIGYYVHSLKKDNYYYYKNLGLTKRFLWISSLTIDFIVFLILIILTLNVR